MRRILDRVTITGADDQTDFSWMRELQIKYPFMEWGILLSKHAQGKPRFPSFEWQEELAKQWHESKAEAYMFTNMLRLSGHLCGRWVRDICKANWTFLEECPTWPMFQRLQLNFHAQIHKIKDRAAFLEQFELTSPHCEEFIFQLDDVNNDLVDEALNGGVNAQPFFDLSGGVGALPEEWQAAREGAYCGYAGGLSPENVHKQLEQIEKVCGDKPVWIDTETHVRTIVDGRESFDPKKVEAFLEAAKPWVLETHLVGY